MFLTKALMPLHKPKCVGMYHQQLGYCVTQVNICRTFKGLSGMCFSISECLILVGKVIKKAIVWRSNSKDCIYDAAWHCVMFASA